MWQYTFICDLTHSCVTWLIRIRQDSFICNITHQCATGRIHWIWLVHNGIICPYAATVICSWATGLILVQHGSFICDTHMDSKCHKPHLLNVTNTCHHWQLTWSHMVQAAYWPRLDSRGTHKNKGHNKSAQTRTHSLSLSLTHTQCYLTTPVRTNGSNWLFQFHASHTYICQCMYILNMYVCMSVCMYVCMYVCMQNVRMYVYTCVCVWIYIYTYTYICIY